VHDRDGRIQSKLVEAAGIELPQESAGNWSAAEQSGAKSGALDKQNGPFDAELAEVVQAWPNLPEAIRAGILAMVRAARGAA
jgi:hypothetical protein